MNILRSLHIISLPALSIAASPALSQTSVPPAPAPSSAVPEEESADDIIVNGRAVPRGSVVGDIAPEVVLGPQDIRAYGASTVAELLEELSPLTGSIQGRDDSAPVVLLGGRRISGFREVRDLPPEAIVRVDILPEEVALKYGYRADQKVVNIVLRRRFNAVTAEAEAALATDGGRQQYEGDVNYLRIADGSRLSLDAEYQRRNPLFESERDLVAADPDRTLLAAADAAKLNTTYNRTIFGTVSATANAELQGEDSRAGLGRALDGSQRLLRDTQARNGSLGLAFNGDLADWRWSLTGGYNREQATTLTDRQRLTGIGRDRARSVATTIETEAVANGAVAPVPAGDLAATVKIGLSARGIDSTATRGGTFTEIDLTRDQASAQANIDLPLTSRRRDVLPALGDLSLNANATVEQLSDFGTLSTFGYGMNWEPVDAIRLIASMTHEEGAPGIRQLGDPVIATPNVRVLDLTRGETVDVTRIDGGNPLLPADNRRVMKLGLTLTPAGNTNLAILANYTDTRIDNPTASFPTVTAEIEAAFPDRFVRDQSGRLIQVDSRPISFQRSERRQMRWGFNWSQALEAPERLDAEGRPISPAEIEKRRAARRERRNAEGRERRRSFGGGGGRQGRVQIAAFHTWRLEDSILIRDGVPELDLLRGSAIGARGGRPRHEVELRAGYTRSGLGARLNVDWQSSTTVRVDPASGAPSADDLTFGDLATVNLRLFADLGQQRRLANAASWLAGARVTLAVDNLFNQRLQVRDATGATPIGFQPDLLDPLGRSIRVSFRKLFF